MLPAHTVSMVVIVSPWKTWVMVSMRPHRLTWQRASTLSTGSPTLASGRVLINWPGAGLYS